MATNVIRQDVIELTTKVNGSELDKLRKELDQLKKIVSGLDADKPAKEMDKLGKTNTDKLNNGLKKVKDNLSGIGNKAAGVAYNGLKKVAGVSFKALSVGITAAAAGLGVMAKNAVEAYSEYEQLTGGVETLFKGDSQIIMKYANDAYKTAGLSANDYMNTITSFSASLLQGLGGDTKKAAEYGNTAITDMADNANKMGLKNSSCKTNLIAGTPLEPNKPQRDLKKCA